MGALNSFGYHGAVYIMHLYANGTVRSYEEISVDSGMQARTQQNLSLALDT